MAYILNRSIITKKIIDLCVQFLRENFATNKLYQNTKITDRFSLTGAQIPCIIVRNTSNTQRRVHFDDLVEQIDSQVELIPLSTDNNLVGNNIERVNLPATVDWNPIRPFDQSIPMASGTDINVTILTSGTAPYNETTYTTGIIITVPSSNTYKPVSLVYGVEEARLDGTPSPITSGSIYSLAIGMDLPNDQFYLMYSGAGISGVNALPINGNEYIVNPSGMQSGVAIKVGDVLFAGDQYQLNFYDSPRYVADRFGGIYNITINFDCFAETTIEVQELTDFVERFLVEKKFELYDLAGINLTSWSMGGQTEQAHINEYIFQSSVTVECFNEWFDIRSVETITSSVASAQPTRKGVVPLGTYWANVPLSGIGTMSSGVIATIPVSGVNSLARVLIDPDGIFTLPSGAYIAPGVITYTNGQNEAFDQGPFVTTSGIYI